MLCTAKVKRSIPCFSNSNFLLEFLSALLLNCKKIVTMLHDPQFFAVPRSILLSWLCRGKFLIHLTIMNLKILRLIKTNMYPKDPGYHTEIQFSKRKENDSFLFSSLKFTMFTLLDSALHLWPVDIDHCDTAKFILG